KEPVAGVGGERGCGPVPVVEVAPDRGNALSAGEEPAGQDPPPGPGLVGESEAHRRGGGVGASFGAALDEVPPDGCEEQALHEGVEAAAEGDGLAAMVGEGVSQED